MIPNNLQPAPGRVILLTVPNHWGKGASKTATSETTLRNFSEDDVVVAVAS